MNKQYIENKWAWAKNQKRIGKLLENQYESLSIQEKLEIAYDRYHKHEKISYAEYEMMAMNTNDEIWFFYNNTEYQIDYGLPNITSMYITVYDGKQKVSERSENYSSVIELLDQFRIDGKTIKEIWESVKF